MFVRFLFFFILVFQASSAFAKYAAIVMDQKGNILHQENATATRHPASLTKKMTLYLLFEALRTKKITMNTRLKTSVLATRQEPTKINLRVGESISIETCIKALIAKSANDVAIVVAEGLAGSVKNFVKQMNAKAAQLGLTSTHFRNSSGLPDSKQVTSAMDMVKLAQAIYNDFPEYYHFFQTQTFSFGGNLFYTHNRMLGNFPGLDGLKTGFINASGFNISTSAVRRCGDQEHRLFVVVMGGQTRHARDRRVAQLLETNFRKLGAGQTSRLPAPGTKGIRDSQPVASTDTDLNTFIAETPEEHPGVQSVSYAESPKPVSTPTPSPILYGQSSITPEMQVCLAPEQEAKQNEQAVLSFPLEKKPNLMPVQLKKAGLPAQWVVGTLPNSPVKQEKAASSSLKKVKKSKVTRKKTRLMRA